MFISSHDSGETSIKNLEWTCSSQRRDCPCKLSLAKESWQSCGSPQCSSNGARLGKAGHLWVHASSLQAREGSKARSSRAILQIRQRADTKSQWERWGEWLVPVAAGKWGGYFFPLHTGVKSQLTVRGHFSKLSTFLKAECLPWQYEPCPESSCVLLLADTVTRWQHCRSPCMWLCQSLDALISSTSSCLAPLHFWCFSPLILLSKEKETAGGASSRRDKWDFLHNTIGTFSSPSLCWEELWAIRTQRGSVGYVV